MVGTTLGKHPTRVRSSGKAHKTAAKSLATRLPTPSAARSAVSVVKSSAKLPYLSLFLQEPLQQIETIKSGVPAFAVKQIAGDLDIDQAGFLRALNLKTATLNRRAARAENLPADESERVVGLARLVGQVEAMVRQSGDPGGFNAAEWLARWLREPQPALGGRLPVTLLDTMAGQGLVSQTLARMQSGAYG